MLRNLLLFLLYPLIAFSQTLEEAKQALQAIDRLEQIDDFMSNYPDWRINEGTARVIDDSPLTRIVNATAGEVFEHQFRLDSAHYVVKVLGEREVELVQVKYIFLDGNQRSKAEIEAIRAEIHTRHNNGEALVELVKTNTMDGNLTGDLVWFREDSMVEEFEQTVRPRKKGELFNVDIPRQNGYYIVFKTHDNKSEKAKVYAAIQFFR